VQRTRGLTALMEREYVIERLPASALDLSERRKILLIHKRGLLELGRCVKNHHSMPIFLIIYFLFGKKTDGKVDSALPRCQCPSFVPPVKNKNK